MEAELRLSGLAEAWSPLLNAPGSFNSCDVWFQVDGALEFQDEFRLFAINGPIKVPLLGQKQIQQAQAIWKNQGGGRWSGILFSVRSRPCDGFKLEVAPATGGAGRPRSQWRMECWWDCGGPYSDDAGRIMVDPWGINGDPSSQIVEHYRSPPGGEPIGTSVLTGYPGVGNRYDLIWLSVSNSSASPAEWRMQVASLAPPVTFNALNCDTSELGSPWIYDGPGRPGIPNGRWEMIVPATPGPPAFYVVADFRRSPAYPGN